MSWSSHVFTKTEFQIHEKRILNFHKSQQFLFVFVNHINLIYEVFFYENLEFAFRENML